MSNPLYGPEGSVIRVLVPDRDTDAGSDSGVHRAFLLPTPPSALPGPRVPASTVHPGPATPTPASVPTDRRTWAVRGGVWLLLVIVAAGLVCYPIGPLFSSRAQATRTDDLRLAVGEAYGAAHNSLAGALPDTRAPLTGAAVGLVQLPRLALQQAVAEGADPETLRGGPGHVPGTAGLGQPGNSVVVGRAAAFGAAFGGLEGMRVGDQIIVVTTQGQSVYVVSDVRRTTVTDAAYDPSSDDRLTLLSSGSRLPWSSSAGVMVVARLSGSPYVPTPQNGYAAVSDGRHGDPTAWALVALELLGLGLVLAATYLAYRRWTGRMAYLVTTPPLVAMVVFLALSGSRLFPGWA